jgi:hypothetical protein
LVETGELTIFGRSKPCSVNRDCLEETMFGKETLEHTDGAIKKDNPEKLAA